MEILNKPWADCILLHSWHVFHLQTCQALAWEHHGSYVCVSPKYFVRGILCQNWFVPLELDMKQTQDISDVKRLHLILKLRVARDGRRPYWTWIIIFTSLPRLPKHTHLSYKSTSKDYNSIFKKNLQNTHKNQLLERERWTPALAPHTTHTHLTTYVRTYVFMWKSQYFSISFFFLWCLKRRVIYRWKGSWAESYITIFFSWRKSVWMNRFDWVLKSWVEIESEERELGDRKKNEREKGTGSIGLDLGQKRIKFRIENRFFFISTSSIPPYKNVCNFIWM